MVALLGAGALLTRIGSRAAVVLCGGLPLVAFASSAPVFVAALVVFGVGNSLLDVAMNARAARVEEGYGRPIFAAFHAFWNIGGLAGSGVDALMEALHVPFSAPFPVAGAVLLALRCGGRALFLTGADAGRRDGVRVAEPGPGDAG